MLSGGCFAVGKRMAHKGVIRVKESTKKGGQAVFWCFLHTMWKGTMSDFTDCRRRSWNVLIVN